jgi:predicted RNase H-like HicB family nuclease
VIVPPLPEVHTFGETYEQALRNAHEAIELALRGRWDAGEEIPPSDEPRVERVTASIPAA